MLLLSCSEPELQKSVFIADDEFPELPEYSEWGYNTFGALYDRQPFVSNDFDVPMQVTHEQNTTTLHLNGQLGTNRWNGGTQFRLIITIPDFHPASYGDLIQLHQLNLDLTNESCRVFFEDIDGLKEVAILEGNFEIKRAQNLRVDEESEQIILSGVFEFRAVVDGNPVSVSNGRFDVGIGSYNFFNF
jgi:hypothetical protein